MIILKLILYPLAILLGICLIPVAFIIAIPDILMSIKDALLNILNS